MRDFQLSLGFVSIDLLSGNWFPNIFIRVLKDSDDLSFEFEMDGANLRLRGKSPRVMGGLKWESCEKTFPAGQVRVANESAGRETRAMDGPRVACVRNLVVLLRQVDVIRRGTGL